VSAPHFEIIVPSYNALPWLETCLDSIAAQTYPAKVTVLDDASTVEGEADFVRRYCANAHWRAILNGGTKRCPYNLSLMIGRGQGLPNDVILIVDGDDWLPHDQVVAQLANVYTDPTVWLTWGSYTRWPDPTYMPNPAAAWPDDVVEANAYRRHTYSAFNHPLAFRRHLWERITDAELQDDQGEWFQAGYDAAIMFPMTELAGGAHGRFLPDVLYTYNESNPISDGRARPRECERVHDIVRGRPPRQPIT
jgi:glycosyltransferase involved in cell wall biosynthesis